MSDRTKLLVKLDRFVELELLMADPSRVATEIEGEEWMDLEQEMPFIAAEAATALREVQQDAARFIWTYSDTDKGDWINEYLRGVREHWTLDQWRASIDSARKE